VANSGKIRCLPLKKSADTDFDADADASLMLMLMLTLTLTLMLTRTKFAARQFATIHFFSLRL
ncbi:MAG: hypothetical protein ACI90V_012544, partial [Bacillariaceae sp.]|jgi:hypothetical protein